MMTTRRGLVALLLVLIAAPAWAQGSRPAPKEAMEPVMKQLEAFRRGDFDVAYAFASAGIQEQFDRPAFEEMVKGGYPEIAQSTSETIFSSALAPDGHAYVAVKVQGANGNNIEIADDLVRRSLQCDLDANMEQPYLRDFKSNPLRDILGDRGRYIAAVLTIARAYIVAGKPNRPQRLSSFEAWSDLVRGPLIWLGRADPVDTIRQLINIDPAREQRARIFQAIFSHYPADFTVADVIIASRKDNALHDALLAVARGKGKSFDEIVPERVAFWLKRNANKIAAGLKLVRASGQGARAVSWSLQQQPIAEI